MTYFWVSGDPAIVGIFDYMQSWHWFHPPQAVTYYNAYHCTIAN